ncbi:MAG: DUF3604 domain-containing protein, partial [Thermoanaerobaculia bacterium]
MHESRRESNWLIPPFVVALVVIALVPGISEAQSIGEPGRGSGQPNPLKNVYFGEQHIHTRNSPDAFAMGTRGTWDDVYRYAMGEEITLSTTGQKIKKLTPYDFVGVTDHSEYFGVMPRLIDPKDPLSKSAFAKSNAGSGRQLRRPGLPDQYHSWLDPDQHANAGVCRAGSSDRQLGALCR